MEAIKILIIDDEPNSTQLLRKLLTKKGYYVEEENDSRKAYQIVKERFFDIIVSDLQMPEVTGMDILKIKPQDTIFIMITGYGSIATAVESMKLGAFDYINKPFDIDEFLIKVDKAAENIKLTRKVQNLESIVGESAGFKNIIGKSKKMKEVFDFIEKVSKVNVSVLIEGESGTGKELVARAIHNSSNRKDKPFIALNCSAIPENLLESELFGHAKGAFTGAVESQKGVFEQAEGGTLFLDEISEMPYNLQAKLLRVTENFEVKPLGSERVKKIDVRIISATNQNLLVLIGNKVFREDLYYRLATFQIKLPPLRERRSDIPLIVNHYLKILSAKLSKELTITSRAMDVLMGLEWKGNVRELENVLEQAAILTNNGIIDAELLPRSSTIDILEECLEGIRGMSLKDVERRYINKVLKDVHSNKVEAAKILGIDRKTLYKKIVEYGLEK
ncbi:MAG: sigma-54-dependent transcriptional regulator [Ignavibacteria bacterium]